MAILFSFSLMASLSHLEQEALFGLNLKRIEKTPKINEDVWIFKVGISAYSYSWIIVHGVKRPLVLALTFSPRQIEKFALFTSRPTLIS